MVPNRWHTREVLLKRLLWDFFRIQYQNRMRRPNPYRLFTETGILLLHIPRTGGTSLFEALYGINLQGQHRYHLTAREFDFLNPVLFRRLLKVAVVRDPVARLESVYDFWCRNPAIVEHGLCMGAYGRQIFAKASALPDFARRVAAAPADAFQGEKMLMPQTAFLATPTGYLGANILIPYANLSEGAAEVLARARVRRGLFHRNLGAGTRGLRESDPDVADEILSYYAADAALWAACSPPILPVDPGTPADVRGTASRPAF